MIRPWTSTALDTEIPRDRINLSRRLAAAPCRRAAASSSSADRSIAVQWTVALAPAMSRCAQFLIAPTDQPRQRRLRRGHSATGPHPTRVRPSAYTTRALHSVSLPAIACRPARMACWSIEMVARPGGPSALSANRDPLLLPTRSRSLPRGDKCPRITAQLTISKGGYSASHDQSSRRRCEQRSTVGERGQLRTDARRQMASPGNR